MQIRIKLFIQTRSVYHRHRGLESFSPATALRSTKTVSPTKAVDRNFPTPKFHT